MKFETLSVHLGRSVDADSGAVTPPLHMSTTFQRDADGGYAHGYSYIRADNPTRHSLEQCLAALEGGADATCYASGVAASLAVFSLLRPGQRIVAPIEAYHGTNKQLRDLIAPMGVRCDFIDMTDPAKVAASLQEPAQLVWIETPSNPMLKLSDISAIVELAHRQGACVGCDNTFATPVWQKPLQLGADLVMHSSTKYFGGHSDVMGGVVITRERGELAARLRDYQATAGSVPSPFDCWMLRRSLTTLACRVRAQTQSAQRIAEFLSEQAAVAQVLYPGLPGHPRHAVAARQMQGGFGAVLSFCVRGGRDEAFAVANAVQLFTRATSLGGVESLIEHRASIEGPHSVTPPSLLRLSIGLEHVDDLLADLAQALS